MANDLTAGDGINTGGFLFSAPDHLSENNFIGKLDFNLGSKHRLFAKYSYIGEKLGDNVNGATVQFPGDPITHFIIDTSYTFSVGDTWTISSNKVNQFTVGQARSRRELSRCTSIPREPTTSVSGPTTDRDAASSALLTSRRRAQRRDISIPIFRDDFSYQRGTHNFQMGGTFKPIRALSNEVLDLNAITMGLGGESDRAWIASLRPGDIHQDPVQRREHRMGYGSRVYRRVASPQFQQNLNYDLAQNPTPQDHGNIRKWRYYETEIYAQDTWRMRNDLTLTYGVALAVLLRSLRDAGIRSGSKHGCRDLL